MFIVECDMSEKVCIEIVEQTAIFDGRPEFSLPLAAVVNLLNFHSFGGTTNDLKEALADKSIDNPKRYRVSLHLYCEEL